MPNEQLGLFRNRRLAKDGEYLRILTQLSPNSTGVVDGIPAFELDIHYSIPQLAYLTNNYYRYYGKYPSVLGGYLIDNKSSSEGIFDNYLGCGTTAVEAVIRCKSQDRINKPGFTFQERSPCP